MEDSNYSPDAIKFIIGGVAIFLLIAFGGVSQEPTGTTKRNIPSIENFSWHKSGFDTILTLDVEMKNNSTSALKDITIACVGIANSGTELGTTEKTIYEVIPPGEKKHFKELSVGFINSQVAKIRCDITNAISIP